MISRTILPYGRFAGFVQRRFASIFSSLETSPVIISSNKDIYTNLALEHTLYNKLRFRDTTSDNPDSQDPTSLKKPVVLLWTDEPCIVIGRHQNPWVEANVGLLNKFGIKLARRHSGGGCVYHDEGNINISIIGHRKTFENRQENLMFLSNFLESTYGVRCKPTQRHDLVHCDTGFKITGSAAKLGRYNSYHHFTLLIDTDKEALYTSIRQEQQDFIQTKSTCSKRSKVINLKDIKSNITVEQVLSDLAVAYGNHFKDHAGQQAEKKDRSEGDKADVELLNKYKQELMDWEWIYAKTPKFKLERILPLIDQGTEKKVKLSVTINKGRFESVDIIGDVFNITSSDTFKSLLGTQFNYLGSMVDISKLLQDSDKTVGGEKVLLMLLLQMVYGSHF